MRRAIFRGGWLLAAPLLTSAAVLPPLHGDVTGQLHLRGLPTAPPVAWRVRGEPAADGRIEALVTARAPGLVLDVTVTARPGQPLRWHLTRGSLDLGAWWPPAAARPELASAPPDLAVSGTLELTGEGEWTADGPVGTLAAQAAGLAVGSTGQGWSVPALDLEARLALRPAGPVLQRFHVAADEATVSGVALRRIQLAAAGDSAQRLEVTEASLEVFGGRVALQPFAFDPLHPVVAATADLADVALADLAALMPQALSEARGRVSGRISVRWDAKLGVQPRGGSLHLVADSPATLRLAASPGFLTQRLPERIAWLPDGWQPLSRWLSLENPAYDTVRRIELGQMPLAVDDLRIELYPDGPDGLRSALIEVTARPATPGTVVDQVTFAVNVAGPLNQVLRLGTDQRVKLQLGLKP